MKRARVCFVILLLVILLSTCWTLTSGPVRIPFADLLDALLHPDFSGDGGLYSRILWDIRIPKMFAAVLAGVSLSVAGLCLQTVFRNPLCGPFVLGISSGASLGVALSMLAGFAFGGLGVLGAASIGAMAVTAVVMFISVRFRHASVLLVSGLLVGYLIDGLVSVLVAGSEAESLRAYVAWGMGSFGRLVVGDVWIYSVAVLAGLALIVCSMRYLNVAALGDDFARGLGIRVGRFRLLVLLGASILAGASTAFCGPVAFVGIAVPHLAFTLFRTSNHRVLLPATAMCGATLCLLAGMFPVSVPLNAILSVVGVPVILFVILRGSRKGNLL